MIERDDRVQKLFNKDDLNEDLLKQKQQQVENEKDLIKDHQITTKAELAKSLARLTLDASDATDLICQDNDEMSNKRTYRRARRV